MVCLEFVGEMVKLAGWLWGPEPAWPAPQLFISLDFHLSVNCWKRNDFFTFFFISDYIYGSMAFF